MWSNPQTQPSIEKPKPAPWLVELVHALRVATDTWFQKLEDVARSLEALHQELMATKPGPPVKATPPGPPVKAKPAPAVKRPPQKKAPAPSRAAATGHYEPPMRTPPVLTAPPPAPVKRPTMGGLDGPVPGTAKLPDPLTKAPNALTDAQRAESLPVAETIARNLVTMLGAGHHSLRDGLKGQLALEHVPYDEQLLSDALQAAEA